MSSSDGGLLSDSSVEFHTFMQWRDGRGERRRQPGREESCAVIGCRACLSPPVSSGSCAVRAVSRSSPNGHHLPLNNVRAIRVLHGSKSHPDSQTQPAGLILTSTGTSRIFFSTPKNDQIRQATVTLFMALFSSARWNALGRKSPRTRGDNLWVELWGGTVYGAHRDRSGPPASGDAFVEIDLCSFTFPPGRSGADLLGGILQHIRPQKAPLYISLSPKSCYLCVICVCLPVNILNNRNWKLWVWTSDGVGLRNANLLSFISPSVPSWTSALAHPAKPPTPPRLSHDCLLI